jgi:serine/threonine protein kinase
VAKEKFPQPFGKYILLEKIALGGMAEIFRAKTIGAEGFEREVVIKRILPHYTEDEAFTRMFIDEATIAAKLHHANIVQIFDFDKVDDTYYIAMEFVEGKDLKKIRERLTKNKESLTVWQIVSIGIEVAKALQYAHSRAHKGQQLSIVHRDVSPQNIMISYAGEVKLMDFGIAKAAERSTKTRAGTVKGKVAYMSPEQARGKTLDRRSDLFALGVIMWEMLTRKRLFSGETDFETLSNVLNQDIVPPSTHNPDVPKELDAVILKALEKEPDQRHDDCGQLQRELSRIFYSSVENVESTTLNSIIQENFEQEIKELEEAEAGKTMMLQDMVRQQRASRTSQPSMPQAPAGDDATQALPAMSESTQVNAAAPEDEDLKATMPLADLQAQALERLNLSANAAKKNKVGPVTLTGTPHYQGGPGSYTTIQPRTGVSPLMMTLLLIGAVGVASAVAIAVTRTGNSDTQGEDIVISDGGGTDSIAPRGRYSITFSTQPSNVDAIIYVDGEAIEGFTIRNLELGQRIKAYAEFDGRRSPERDIFVRDKESMNVALILPKEKTEAALTIVSQNAIIRVDGEEKGKNEVEIRGPPGKEVKIEAEFEDGSKEEVTVLLGTKSVVVLQQTVELVTLKFTVDRSGAVVTVNGITYLPNNNIVSIPNIKMGTEVQLTARKRGCTAYTKTMTVQKGQLEHEISLQCKVERKTRYGRVTIQARPFAYVFYRGRNIGTTPIKKRRMRVGSHTFKLTNQQGTSKTITLRVTAGKTASTGTVDMR